jgi:hypothetical protein
MADTNLLAALLSGSNPLAPQMLGGYQGAQLSDAALNPAFAHNEGPFGALAKTLAGFSGGPMMRQAVEATTAANNAARPEVLAAMNSPGGPLQYAAQNPDMSQTGLAQILAQDPAKTIQQIEAARLGRLNAANPMGATSVSAAAPGIWPKIGPATAGGVGGASLIPTTIANDTTGRPSASPAGNDPFEAIQALPAQARPAAIAGMNKQQLAVYLAKLRQMKGGQSAAQP